MKRSFDFPELEQRSNQESDISQNGIGTPRKDGYRCAHPAQNLTEIPSLRLFVEGGKDRHREIQISKKQELILQPQRDPSGAGVNIGDLDLPENKAPQSRFTSTRNNVLTSTKSSQLCRLDNPDMSAERVKKSDYDCYCHWLLGSRFLAVFLLKIHREMPKNRPKRKLNQSKDDEFVNKAIVAQFLKAQRPDMSAASFGCQWRYQFADRRVMKLVLFNSGSIELCMSSDD
ncbi:hypothetical protein B0H13DRAFT_1928802 [Mycena leptocephala]|nr:hypothetical protein B0H13DRAFT_1928802 [Mycena leptocephala]